MKEIAKKAGVSQATVSRVINGHSSVTPDKRQKVMEWVRKLDYQPNLTAQSLVSNQSYLIGIVVPDISNPFFSEVVRVVESEADQHGYSVIICNTEGNLQKERNYINVLRSRQVDGILLVPSDATSSHLNSLKKANTPVVVITQNLTGFDSVSLSHMHGGEQVAKHLLDLGHTNIVFVAGSKKDEKFIGFKRTLRQNGIIFNDDNFIECGGWQLNSREVYNKVKTYLSKKENSDITALFAYNDLAAFGAMHAIQDLGLDIPKDIALIGFDNTFLSAETRPSLSTVAQPTGEMGRISLEILFKRITAKESEKGIEVILEPRLVVRESTRGIDLDL